ncbi:sugar kinase [Acidipropionibacterium timonense]|uniref:sugar kinase n=1 Tax=Acidipropionibacterium timonense TaxID=2161818 RepID=UPI0010325030|nr:sugar kinase [Acidipropionibacterium timonense]
MTYDISTIGEGQIRLTCFKGERLSSAQELRMTAACSEANVAGLLSQLGRRTSWASVMPRGELAARVINEFRGVGVDVSHVCIKPEGRVALYFMEPGEYPMPARVTYDRLHTPFRDVQIDDLDWEAMLDTKLVFVTGITAALTENTAKVVTYFVEQAHERGIRIALDVNYRSLLWEPEDARRVLEPIALKSDIVFCSRRDGQAVFGMEGNGPHVCHALRERFGVRTVVSTDQVDGIYLSDADRGELAFEVVRVPILDRPGAGDSFVAGTLHGFMSGDVVQGIKYGQRTSAYALTHYGDLTHISPNELDIPTSTDILR